MSERERWIVYPLLFLALGVALRDELFDQTWSRRVVCERLTVIDSEGSTPTEPFRIATLGRRSNEGIADVGELHVNTVRATNVVAKNFIRQGVQIRPNQNWLKRLQELMEAAEAQRREQSATPPANTPPPGQAQPPEAGTTSPLETEN